MLMMVTDGMRISLAISSDNCRHVAPGARLWQDLGQNKGGQDNRSHPGRKRMLRAVTSLILAALLASAVPARAADHIVFVIPADLVQLLPIYIAEDQGLWRDAGFDVKMVTIPSVGGMNAVIAGSADFSFSTGSAITRAAAHGQQLVAIVELGNQSGQILILRKDVADAAGFDPTATLAIRAKTLKGRTIAVGGIGSIADAFLKVIAHEGGLDANQIVTTPMSAAEFTPAFAQHKIDGFVFGSPFAQQAVVDGTGVVIADNTKPLIPDLSPSAAGLLVTRPAYCGEQRAICEKMGHSMVEAVNFVYEHRQESIANLRKHFPTVSDAVLAASYDGVKAMTPRPPVTSARDLANSELINVRAGFLKPEEKLKSYDALFTNEFVK
jgi:ABC-type nitrate/sulfonate/bicarbonate transport system substrate-binding protein